MPARKVDVKAQLQRAGHEGLVFIQLGHVDIQVIAGVGFRTVESDALDSVWRLHGIHCLSVCDGKRSYSTTPGVSLVLSGTSPSILLRLGIVSFMQKYKLKIVLKKYIAMADDGDLSGYRDPELEHRLDNDDDKEQEVDRTRPFRPAAALTPYHGVEQCQMQTMIHEQSGLPDTSYEETPLLGAQSERQNS